MGKNHPGKNARLRAKKRMLRAIQALLNGTTTTDDHDALAGLTKTQRIKTKRRVRQITQQRLNGIEIRTQADAAVMKHTMDQAVEENKDWRLRVETVNASFQERQRTSLTLGLENMQRVAVGHNALQEHVKRAGMKIDIVSAKLELVGENVAELREQAEAERREKNGLRERNAKLEKNLEAMLGTISALQSEIQQLHDRDSDGKSGKQQGGENHEEWKGRLRSRKKA